jgi:hypothetical protein
MGTNTIGNQNWKLTLIRDYKVSQKNEIEDAMFAYGRTASELEDETRESAHLPTGLIHLLDRTELTSEAMESGFITEISTSNQDGEDWHCFTRTALGVKTLPGIPFQPTRAFYVIEDGEQFFEMIDLSCRRQETSLPLKIWMRVIEIEVDALAWAIDSNFYSCDGGHQSTLDSWIDLGKHGTNRQNFSKLPPLPLPGPPDEEYTFL